MMQVLGVLWLLSVTVYVTVDHLADSKTLYPKPARVCLPSIGFFSHLSDSFHTGVDPGGWLWAQDLWLWIFYGCSMVQKHSRSQCHSLRYCHKWTHVAHLGSSFHFLGLWLAATDSLWWLWLIQGPTITQKHALSLTKCDHGSYWELFKTGSSCFLGSNNFLL